MLRRQIADERLLLKWPPAPTSTNVDGHLERSYSGRDVRGSPGRSDQCGSGRKSTVGTDKMNPNSGHPIEWRVGFISPKHTRVGGQVRNLFIARFFSRIDNSNVALVVANINRENHYTLADLLGRSNAFDRCDSAGCLNALRGTGVPLNTMLTSKKLVQAYDAAVRTQLLAHAKHAEHLVSKYLYESGREGIYLPPSFTTADGRDLMNRYIESADANQNYVGLIESAPVSSPSGVDAKLKLKAKRRDAQMTAEFFKTNAGMRTGCELTISESQEEPVSVELDEMVTKATFSARWLEETTHYPSILNNVQHVFGFADQQCLLTLPAYPADMSVLERHLEMKGKTDYHFGIWFRTADTKSLLEVRMLHGFLRSKDIDVEAVISWFFGEYLVKEFGAENFSFTPSRDGTTYLQKVRHLFAEMESVAHQFSLYVQAHSR